MKKVKNILITLVGIVSLIVPSVAAAATISPSGTGTTVGKDFTISVTAYAGAGEKILGVGSTSVTTSNLKVISVSVNGAIDCQINKPSVGNLRFDGCFRNDNAPVTSMLIFTARVRGINAGTAKVTINGGNILRDSGPIQYLGTITKSYTITAVPTPAPKPTPKPTPTPAPTTGGGTTSAAVTPSSTTTQSSQTASPSTTAASTTPAGQEEVLGEEVAAQVDEGTADNEQAETDTRSNKILGLAWYWWLLVLLPLGLVAYNYFTGRRIKDLQ